MVPLSDYAEHGAQADLSHKAAPCGLARSLEGTGMDSSRRFTPGVALTSVLPTFRPNSARVIAVAQTLALPRLPELVALRVGWCVSGLPRPVGPAALHAVLPIVLPSNICVNADSGNPHSGASTPPFFEVSQNRSNLWHINPSLLR